MNRLKSLSQSRWDYRSLRGPAISKAKALLRLLDNLSVGVRRIFVVSDLGLMAVWFRRVGLGLEKFKTIFVEKSIKRRSFLTDTDIKWPFLRRLLNRRATQRGAL